MATTLIQSPINFEQKFYWKKNKENSCEQKYDLRKSNSNLENIDTQQNEQKFYHNKSVVCTKFNPHLNLIATSSLDGIIRLFTTYGQLKGELKLKNDYDRTISFSMDGQFLASSGAYDKIIRIWNLKTFTLEKELFGTKNKILKISFLRQQQDKLLTICSDNSIQLWDISTQSVITVSDNNQNQITSFDITDDDTRCVIGCIDGTIKELDIKNQSLIKSWKAHTKGCFSLKYPQTNNFLISGGSDKIIKIWNMHNKKLFTQFKDHNSIIYAINIKEDNIISSQFNLTIIWNWKTQQMVKRIPKTQIDYCFIEIMDDKFITGCPGNGIEVQSIL